MVDAEAEIKKLEKQLGLVDGKVAGLERQMNIPGYEEKVRQNPPTLFLPTHPSIYLPALTHSPTHPPT